MDALFDSELELLSSFSKGAPWKCGNELIVFIEVEQLVVVVALDAIERFPGDNDNGFTCPEIPDNVVSVDIAL